MSITIRGADYAEWQRHGLAEFEDFAVHIRKCNIGKDADGVEYGEWFFVPETPLANGDRVIYYGGWDRDSCPGVPSSTYATLFNGTDPDELAEFSVRVQHLEGRPPLDQQP